MTQANEPTFPYVADYYEDGEIIKQTIPGLTKREYFAAMALPGLLADTVRRLSLEEAVKASVYISDEIIKALNA